MPERPRRAILVCADCEGSREQIERLREWVGRLGLRVNFFFTGRTAEEFPDLVRAIAREHSVDSHTFDHPRLRGMDEAAQRAEVRAGRAAVESVIGRRTHGFRAPYHAIDRNTVRVLNEEGFAYDLSGLYHRLPMGHVIELRPTWFREWTEVYGWLGLPPRFGWDLVRVLLGLADPLVIPLHPHYAGRSDEDAHAMAAFFHYAHRRGAQTWYVTDYLRATGRWDPGRDR